MNPGIHDITIEQYHSGLGVSRSGIEKFRKSPMHYWHEYLNPAKEIKEPTEAMVFGNALHCYTLEPHMFEKRYHIWQKVNGRKPASNTKAWEDIVKQAAGRELLCDEDVVTITSMHRSINNHATATSMLDGGVKEKSLFWTDKDTGILCKVRPDAWHPNLVVDLKTTSDGSAKAFARSIHMYGYHIQCAMINEALFALKGVNMMNFVFVAVEKDAPHSCVVYRLDENAINKGREEFKKALFDMKECIMTDTWPSYADQVLDLPQYAYNNNQLEF